MPTGFTECLSEGVSFNEFALRCTRNFGVMMDMRDEPLGAEIPKEFPTSTYHRDELRQAMKELQKLQKMSILEVDMKAQEEYDSEYKRVDAAIKKCNDLHQKYTDMLAQVYEWQPPTPDHEELKKFMVKQITESIEWDCNSSYYQDNVPHLLLGEKWRKKELARVMEDINYHAEHWATDRKNAASRTKWMQDLRASLNGGS